MSLVASVCACGTYFNVDPDTGELCLNPGTMGLQETLYFKDPGTFQFEKSAYPWLARIRVRVQGAGGGAAGANAAEGQLISRPGGAGGSYSESMIEVSALGAVETIVVGAPGSAGGFNDGGGDGGASSFGGLVTAPGGQGGSANMNSGTGNQTNTGLAGPLSGTGQFVQGGGAGEGCFRLGPSEGMSGRGGESRLGHGGYGRATAGAAGAPRGFGGGAGGGFSEDGVSGEGNEGGGGLVIVELYG